MAMGASTQIVNETGGIIMFTFIKQVNDDATWSIEPSVGPKIENGKSCTISMGNSSFPPFVRGVGFNAQFVNENFELGSIYLDDPAVGKHHFSTGGPFNYKIDNPSGNAYIVTVTPK